MSIWLTLTGRDTHKHVLSFLWSSNVMWSFRGASGQGEALQKADIITGRVCVCVCVCVWLVVNLHNKSEWPSVTQRGNLVLLWQQQVNGAWARDGVIMMWSHDWMKRWLSPLIQDQFSHHQFVLKSKLVCDEWLTLTAGRGRSFTLHVHDVRAEYELLARKLLRVCSQLGMTDTRDQYWTFSALWMITLIKSLQKSSENGTVDVFNPWKHLSPDNYFFAAKSSRVCPIFGNIIFGQKNTSS